MSRRAFDPSAIVHTLNRHNVEYVVIGGMAAAMHGSNTDTYDLDICYSRDDANLVRLVAALREMHATLRGAPAGLPFILDERTLRNGDSFTFTTDYGDFDCLGTPQGSRGFAPLAASATIGEGEDGVTIRIASIDDLLAMKRAAGRPKDIATISALEELRKSQR